MWVYHKGRLDTTHFQLPQERILKLEVNDVAWPSLAYSPGGERALVLGMLFLSGFLESREEVLQFNFDGETARVELRWKRAFGNGVRPSGCGGGLIYARRRLVPLPKAVFDPDLPIRTQQVLRQKAKAYHATGGIHAAGLFDLQGRLLAVAEDIGRHNAVDRVAGEALLSGFDSPFYLAATGRASSEMVVKAVAMGAVGLSTRTGATDRALTLARQYRLALMTYTRPTGYRLYCGAERLGQVLEVVGVSE